jgi:hypothetical protein
MLHFLKLFSIKAGEMRAHASLIHSQSCLISGRLIFLVGMKSCSPVAIRRVYCSFSAALNGIHTKARMLVRPLTPTPHLCLGVNEFTNIAICE